MQARRLSQTAALAMLASLIGSGCSHDSTAQVRTLVVKNSGQELAVTLRTRPDPPRSGNNELELSLHEANGTPVDNATVSALFYMPAMPSMNMPEMHTDVRFRANGAGTYRGTVNLVMSGTWSVRVTLALNGVELGAVPYTVIAK